MGKNINIVISMINIVPEFEGKIRLIKAHGRNR